MGTLLSVSDIVKFYEVRRSVFSLTKETIRAVDSVSFALGEEDTLGIVGESGCGKSTLARCIAFLEKPDSGGITFMGRDWITLTASERRPMRRHMGIIFQDPYSSLNPRKTVESIVSEPLRIRGSHPGPGTRGRVIETLESVGLGKDFLGKYPHEMSGGQRQRIAIARALCTGPGFLIADEPVSALDVSVQAQIINLFLDLKARLHFAMLFISHDLDIVRFVSDHIMVMYKGRVMETGETETIFRNPLHPYTRMLMGAKADDKEASTDNADEAGLSCCPFRMRCPDARERCRRETPPLYPYGAQKAACFMVETVSRKP